MVINDVHFTLRDGRAAVLRSPREEDIKGTLEYLEKSARETDFLLRSPEDTKKYTPEGEKALFEKKNASENEAMIHCVVGGRVAGNCEIRFYANKKIRHRAEIGIALLEEFWGQGIGTKMFQEMIRLAQARPEVLQLELGFVEGNVRARHLYEKMGFRITGVRPNAFRLQDGSLRNEYLMVRPMER